MSILRNLVPAERRGLFVTGPFTDGSIPPNSYATSGMGGNTTPDRAMRLSAVWACVRLLADLISTLPIDGYRRSSDGIQQLVSPVPALLAKPAAMGTFSEWLYQGMVSLLLRGNAYGIIVARNNSLWPTQIEIQNPDHVIVKQDEQGVPYYLVRAKQSGQATKRVDASDMMHVRRWVMPGEIRGLSPITYAARAIELGLGAEQFGADFFDAGGHPTAILSTDTDVTEPQARIIKSRWFDALRGRREPAVLGHGVKYQQVQVAPNESQFLDTTKANVATVARYYGVAPELIGGESGNSLTYANVEQRSLDLLTYTAHGWIKCWEDAITALTPAPQYVKFNTAALLRTDIKTRFQTYAIALQNGIYCPDDVRVKEDLPPLPDGKGQEFNWPPEHNSAAPVMGGTI